MANRRIEFRTLGPDMIEVRPTDTKYKGKATLLLYQTARCPMEILDESLGPDNWQADFKEVAGTVYCGIGIQTNPGEWIWKWNAGTEGNIGEGKSTASDALKRAATMWGIGRELYYSPRVKIDCPDSYYYNDKMTMTFSVQEIEWDENRRCRKLVIVDRFGKEVFKWSKEEKPKKADIQMTAHKDNITILRDFCKDRIAEEPENKDDIIRFGKFYSEKAQNWEGEFKVNRLYDSWVSKRRTA